MAPRLLLSTKQNPCEDQTVRLLVKVGASDAMIVGYVSHNDQIHAVVVMNGGLNAVHLDQIELGRMPKALRHKVRKSVRRQSYIGVELPPVN